MFSKGTFQRYLFEVDAERSDKETLYDTIAARTADPQMQAIIHGFLSQLKEEARVVNEIRDTLGHAE